MASSVDLILDSWVGRIPCQMALDALIVAIPAALIMILIEKLVSMIVPAAVGTVCRVMVVVPMGTGP